MPATRRDFLKRAGAASGWATGAALGLTPFAMHSHAADTSGYKALVCLFMLGGQDAYDVVLPYDASSYGEFADIRESLLSQYANSSAARGLGQLLPIDTRGRFNGREHALAPEWSGLKSLYDAGNAAVVGNVGPLVQPVTRTEVLEETAPLPKRLFSHNDQQSTWFSSQPEGALSGWGGRFADAMLQAGANQGSAQFSTITTLGNELFLTGQQTFPYQVSLRGAPRLEALRSFESGRNTEDGEARYLALRAHFANTDFSSPSLLAQDYAAAMRSALDTNEAYDRALADTPTLSTEFPGSFIGGQLRAVARSIAARTVLSANRQVFFVAIGGFDTHSAQAQNLPNLQRQIDGAIVSFSEAMQELGLGQDVTLFTASDFGRTLAINGDGTDHGWGGHHFVIGEAVRGGQVYGQLPPATFDHDRDAGGGRLIPDVAVEQLAGSLAAGSG